MIMLKEYVGAVELHTALELTVDNYNVLVAHCAIQKSLHSSGPRIFSYPFDHPVCWFVLDDVKNSRPFVHIAKVEEDQVALTSGVRLFFNTIAPLIREDGVDIGADAILLHNVMAILEETLPGFTECSSKAHTVFFMSPEQQQTAAKLKIQLPYGYEFSKLNVADAKAVCEAVGEDDSAVLIGDRIRTQPSTAIIHSATGLLVSHQLSSSRGDMLHLFTNPEHRRQGLGSAAELSLAQKVIRGHETPFKVVPNHLTSVLNSSEDSPFWTMWSRNRLPVQLIVKHIAFP